MSQNQKLPLEVTISSIWVQRGTQIGIVNLRSNGGFSLIKTDLGDIELTVPELTALSQYIENLVVTETIYDPADEEE